MESKSGVETIQKTAHGAWWDELYRKTPDGGDRMVLKTLVQHNLIVQPFTNVVAGLLAGTPNWGAVQMHAIGTGVAAWDTQGIAAPTIFDTKLIAEVHRKAPDSVLPVIYGYGTAAGGTTTSIIDPTRFEPDGFFNGQTITIVSGTNVGQSSTVASYTQSTGTFTITGTFTNPIDLTSSYEITPTLSLTVSNTVQVQTTWDYGAPTDPWNNIYIREQGLFGGCAYQGNCNVNGATVTWVSGPVFTSFIGDFTIVGVGTFKILSVTSPTELTLTSSAGTHANVAYSSNGMMLDNIHHARIWKDVSVRLKRFIRLTFRP